MTDNVDVAIVGAGPYGLSLAAHLRAAGVTFRHFGLPMNLWQSSMPRGMFLKSQGFASNLSSPDGEHTLEAFCAATGRPYKSYGLPVALDTFVAYGLWFQGELDPDLEEVLVTDVVRKDGHFEVGLADGGRLQARNVVVAAGVEHFASMPDELAELSPNQCSHSSALTEPGAFSGSSVVVIGAGQSALESAALLHESGADVQLVARKPKLMWNGPPLALDRPLLQRMREPEAGLGSGWSTWFYSRHPELFRHLPQGTRIYRARTALGPAGAAWLPARVNGQFPVQLGHALKSAKPDGDGVKLGFTGPGGVDSVIAADHVIAATGYRTDLRRLAFLNDQLRPALSTVAGTPVVDRNYESTVGGLYFIGPAVAPTFGPVMRFVYGSDFAARTAAARLTAKSGRRPLASVGSAP
jgi:FAD-dependent urate hydroxylase